MGNFEATACYSSTLENKIRPGTHKLICVRGFPGTYEAINFAMDEYEKMNRQCDGSRLPQTKDLAERANSHYTWASYSDARLKRELSKTFAVNEEQLVLRKATAEEIGKKYM